MRPAPLKKNSPTLSVLFGGVVYSGTGDNVNGSLCGCHCHDQVWTGEAEAFHPKANSSAAGKPAAQAKGAALPAAGESLEV